MAWMAIVATLVGTAGITGLLNVLLQYTRPARLRRTIEHLAAARDAMPNESSRRAQLEASMEELAERLVVTVSGRPASPNDSQDLQEDNLDRHVTKSRRPIGRAVFSRPLRLAILWTFSVIAVISGGLLISASLSPSPSTEEYVSWLAMGLMSMPVIIMAISSDRLASGRE